METSSKNINKKQNKNATTFGKFLINCFRSQNSF